RARRVGATPHRHVHARSAGRGGRTGAGDRAFPLCAIGSSPPARGMLRGLQHPGARVGAARRDHRHPTCRARRLRRARFDPGADRLGARHGLPGPAALRCAGLHAARLCHLRRHEGECKGSDRRARRHHWEIDIRPAARQMLADLDHPFARGEPVYDLTFENVQAGLRTDYLFRVANQRGGLVVGTGDLSELGLGWCTYGVGDHMSHYNVNASVPKTLIQHLIRFVAASGDVSPQTADVLHAVLATEISPELVPAEAGATIQSTQQMVGPYALQDFNLFYLTRYGFRPSRIAYLAECAWATWPAEAGRPRFLTRTDGPIRAARSSTGCGSSSRGFSPTSSSGRCRMGRKSPPAARCRRAATGGRHQMRTCGCGLRNWTPRRRLPALSRSRKARGPDRVHRRISDDSPDVGVSISAIVVTARGAEHQASVKEAHAACRASCAETHRNGLS